MKFHREKSSGKLVMLSPQQVAPSPWQARTVFSQEEIQALAESIRENGLLQPISVRRWQNGYQLIAGERRLRACTLAGLEKIPAILYEQSDAQVAALGLLENMQRQDLNPFDQARGIRDVMELWDCSQAEAAARLGLAQPTLANKLRLLQLTDAQQKYILEHSLTERHARCVLRLPEASRTEALEHMVRYKMTVRAADIFVDQLLTEEKPPPKRTPMVKDVRIFLNTINKAIRLMTDNGVPASATKREGEGFVEYTVRIPTESCSGSEK